MEGEDVFSHLFTLPLFSSRRVMVAFQNFKYPWDVHTSMFSLLCLLSALLSKVKQILKSVIQRSVLRQDSYEWQGEWEDKGRHLEQWAPPMLWKFTPEQLRNPKKMEQCLKKGCHHPGSTRHTQITATCWGLVYAYQATLNTNPAPPRDAAANSTPVTDTAANPSPATDTVANLTSATSTAAPHTPTTNTVAEAES